ncbi:MAG: electron transport complex subunit RsxA [Rikenellaceae bacterium]
MEEITYFAIIIGAIFVNNVVLAQFLGICPFLGVSSKVETSMGMGAAVTFVMAIASVVAWLIQNFILVPLDIVYMQTIVFILVIAALVQMVEIILKKVSPVLYQALGIFLPLITTNCAVLGVAILMIQKEFSLLQSVVYSVSTAFGFGLALVIFAGLRERLDFEEVPTAFRGIPIALVTAGILAMAFMGFSGLV